MHVRRLLPSDATTFQRLRLQALQESPTAFGSSYEEEVERPVGAVAESLDETSGRYIFGAFIGDTLVGIVGVGRESGLKESHCGFIRSMYVAPSARQQGIGKILMGHAMRFAEAMPGLRQITLAVTAGNHAAIATYERFGFKVCGTVPEALHVAGLYYDEIQMVCRLDTA
jgi:ribosomal protein S18 acetylase RimI-like enzyme